MNKAKSPLWANKMDKRNAIIAVLLVVIVGLTVKLFTQAADRQVKPMIYGLLDRGALPKTTGTPFAPPPDTFITSGAISGYAVNASWAELQPTAGGAIARNNVLDKALDYVYGRNAYAGHPHSGFQLELRVFSGDFAPAWAKEVGGAHVSVVDDSGSPGTIGRYWTSRFGNAYADFQNKMAAIYDGEPALKVVTISRCSSFYPEQMIKHFATQANITNMTAAGFNSDLDVACMKSAIDTHAAAWVHTRTGMAFNPYQRLVAAGRAYHLQGETDTSTAMMDYCRNGDGTSAHPGLGKRCVLENYSIRDNATSDNGLGSDYGVVYQHIADLGRPILFQTAATTPKIGDINKVLRWSLAMPRTDRSTAAASAVELIKDYEHAGSDYSPTALSAFDCQYDLTCPQSITH